MSIFLQGLASIQPRLDHYCYLFLPPFGRHLPLPSVMKIMRTFRESFPELQTQPAEDNADSPTTYLPRKSLFIESTAWVRYYLLACTWRLSLPLLDCEFRFYFSRLYRPTTAPAMQNGPFRVSLLYSVMIQSYTII